MDLRFLMLADHVTKTLEGKMVIVGEFNRVRVPAVPAVHGPMDLVARLETSLASGEAHRISIQIVDGDGQAVIEPLDMALQFVPTGPGRPLQADLKVRFNVLPLPKFGDYEFRLLADDRFLGSTSIVVVGPEDGGYVEAREDS